MLQNEPILMSSRSVVEHLYADLAPEISQLTAQGSQPTLAVVLVGDDPNSVTYVGVKNKQAEKIGMGFSLHRLDATTDEEKVIAVIESLNNEQNIHGIIIQLPLPEQLNTDRILNTVAKAKDVDGLAQDSSFTPPTVAAILELLSAYDISLKDKKIVSVGKGRLVGGPLIRELAKLGIKVTACDESVTDLASCTLEADILVSATGERHLITPSMVKEGAVVIDVDEEVVFEEVVSKVAYITPQKGGIGPLTVAFLLSNVVEAAQQTEVTNG